MYSTWYGWNAITPSYEIEYMDFVTKETRILAEDLHKNRFEVQVEEYAPGLLFVYPIWRGNRKKPFVFPINEPPALATMRWMVRTALNDTQEEEFVDYRLPDAPKWPDDELDSYLRESIGLFNSYFTKEEIWKGTIDGLRTSRFLHIKDILQLSHFDHRRGNWAAIPRFGRRGLRRGTRDFHFDRFPDRSWDLSDEMITLYGPFNGEDEVEMTYLRPYKLPYHDTDEIELERDLWDILSIYAQSRAYLRLAGQSAQLDRWKEEGRRDDNPLYKIARNLEVDARERLETRRAVVASKRYRA